MEGNLVEAAMARLGLQGRVRHTLVMDAVTGTVLTSTLEDPLPLAARAQALVNCARALTELARVSVATRNTPGASGTTTTRDDDTRVLRLHTGRDQLIICPGSLACCAMMEGWLMAQMSGTSWWHLFDVLDVCD